MKKILFASLSFLSLLSFGQHSTLRFTDQPIQLEHRSLLVVPFETKMYLSDINRDLAEQNNLNSEEIINRFIQGIDQSFFYTFNKKCDVTSFYQLEDAESDADLKYIYKTIDLEYELASPNQKKKKLSLKQKEEEDKYKAGEIADGQIKTYRDDRERYMKAVISDPKMLDSMHLKFNNEFFLFVTELDIKNDYTDAIAMQSGGYNRMIKLHYTLYHKNGEILTTGISRTTFPSTQNDINEIISNYFPILAANIFNDLFDVNAEEKTKKKLWR